MFFERTWKQKEHGNKKNMFILNNKFSKIFICINMINMISVFTFKNKIIMSKLHFFYNPETALSNVINKQCLIIYIFGEKSFVLDNLHLSTFDLNAVIWVYW